MIRLQSTIVRPVALLLAFAGWSCGDDGGPAGPCLLVRTENVSVAQPAKVSAFFTVDKCTGEPVTDLAATDIEIREDGARVSASESQQRLVRNADKFRVYTILVLDLTASIVRGDQLPAVQDAA